MTTNYVQAIASPSAFVTKNKQRIKQHEGAVYLKNGDTFEIELHNPTQEDILARIELNQKSISNAGIVLRPGERIFLERYIDSNNKFKFDTYEVDNTFEGELATMKNGWVTVTFHNENQYYQATITSSGTSDITYYNHTGSPNWNPTFTTGGDVVFGTTNMNVSNTSGFMDMKQPEIVGALRKSRSIVQAKAKKSVETGKIEKGGTTNQKFKTIDKSFNTFPFETIHWRILPISTKPVTSQEVNKVYCTECGTRIRKSTFKFCPQCGTKI